MEDRTLNSSDNDSKLSIVGVMGSGEKAHSGKSVALGIWLASQCVHLLSGGGGGVMAAVSQAFFDTSRRKGKVIGIVPGNVKPGYKYELPCGYPNPWVEIPIFTHLPHSGKRGTHHQSRNHINVLTSDVIVALPGKSGTSSEVKLAVRYSKPIVAWLDRPSQIQDLPSQVPVVNSLECVKEFVMKNIRV